MGSRIYDCFLGGGVLVAVCLVLLLLFRFFLLFFLGFSYFFGIGIDIFRIIILVLRYGWLVFYIFYCKLFYIIYII